MAKASRSFQYQRRSADDVRERAESRGGNFDTYIKPEFKVYKVKDGKNLIRILPATWEKAKHYAFDVYVNYGIGVDNQSYLSLSKMKGAPDPLAEARADAQKDNDEKTAKALMPRQRAVMWIIDRLEEDEGPQLWPAAFTVDKDIVNLCFDEDTKEIIEIDHPEQGCDLRFHKTGKGLNTKYPASKMKLMAESPIHEDEKLQQEWLNYIEDHPIPDCLMYYSYDHIEKAFGGHVRTKDDDDDDDDEKPRRSRSRGDDDEREERRPSARSSRSRDEDDEDENRTSRRKPRDPEPSEEDEDERPSRRSTERRGRSTAEEPAEEPEETPRRQRAQLRERKPRDEDEEPPFEEDEKPPRRGSREKEPDAEEEGQSIRDRLRSRRDRARPKSEDDDD